MTKIQVYFSAITRNIWATLLFASTVTSHGTQVRHCITKSGDLRIFVQHWHGYTTPYNAGAMVIRNLIDGTTRDIYSTGALPSGTSEANVPLHGDCATGTTVLDSTCYLQPYYQWNYFDFPITCGAPTHVELQQGRTIYFDEACGNLYPVQISGTFTDSSPPIPTLQGIDCVDGTTIEVITDGTNDVTAIANFSFGVRDDCDPSPTVSSSVAPGSVLPLGETFSTLIAGDNAGNTESCTFKISVIRRTEGE